MPATRSVWPSQPEAHVSPQVPGTHKRFAGWSQASGPQREAALRSENALLLAAVHDHGQALQLMEQEQQKLRRANAEMIIRMRNSAHHSSAV